MTEQITNNTLANQVTDSSSKSEAVPTEQSQQIEAAQPSNQNQLASQTDMPTTENLDPNAINKEVSSTEKKVKVSQLEQNKKSTIKLQKKIRLVLEIGTLTIVAMTVISGFLLYYANSQLPLLKSNKEQIAATLYNSSDIQNTVSFLETQEQQTQRIADALPLKDTLIDFIQMIELIMEESSNDSKLEFSAISPVGEQNRKHIPFKVTLTTDQDNFSNFLRKIEKVPYIVEVDSITGTPLGDSSVWSYKLNAKVYVDNQF